jgi:hypothetical protein
MIDGHALRDELDGVRRLLEKERWFARRVRPHLARMGGVVAPDAVDAPHRILLVSADHRDRGKGMPEKSIADAIGLDRKGASGYRSCADGSGGLEQVTA